MNTFLDRLCEAILETDGGDSGSRRLIGRAIADTVAVSAVGFTETVTRFAVKTYEGSGGQAWSGARCESREASVMINAVAAHSPEFDDVYLEALAHPGTIIVPAILHAGASHDQDAIISAAAAGLIAARAVGGRLGQAHYGRGWHGTGTVGVFAATAAAGKLASLGLRQMKGAFGLAAAMSGGLRINFGSMAKPCQAGFAAAGGVRAVRLAAAGVGAADDVFGPGGYFDLYGNEPTTVSDDLFSLRPDRISVKLYPCCYAASRLIGVALDAYRVLGPVFSDPAVRLRMVVPQGSIAVLRYDDPIDCLQAKFSAPYAVSAALVDGFVGLSHFSEAGISRREVRDCMSRLTVEEDETQPSHGELTTGVVRLDVFRKGDRLGSYSRSALPGSPGDAPTLDQIRVKATDCLSTFERESGHGLPILDQVRGMSHVAHWLGQ